MLDVSAGELIVILLVALVVFGPQRLPELARKAGEWARDLRQAARDLRTGLEEEVREVREAVDDARQPLDEAKKALDEARREVDRLESEVERGRRQPWVGPEPTRGPTSKNAMEDLKRIEGRPDDGSEGA
ncbi:MAG: Sec-independent protein translocase subunit TatA/TatB [Acidimicrobiia bacterium]